MFYSKGGLGRGSHCCCDWIGAAPRRWLYSVGQTARLLFSMSKAEVTLDYINIESDLFARSTRSHKRDATTHTVTKILLLFTTGQGGRQVRHTPPSNVACGQYRRRNMDFCFPSLPQDKPNMLGITGQEKMVDDHLHFWRARTLPL